MINALFLGFVVAMAIVVVALSARFLKGRTAVAIGAGLIAWFAYVGLISYFGIVSNAKMRPPGPLFIFVPVILFLVFFVVKLQSPVGLQTALAFPLWIILFVQSFRIIVELFLHQLWIEGLIPKMLTFEGANVDIYIGASAPLIAWLSTRGSFAPKVAFVWNVLGLCALLNVVVRAVLTAPGPLNFVHTEAPNLMIGTFPFTFVPAFFVPLAAVLHAVAIAKIRHASGHDD